LLPGDIKYESPNGNVRIYFPIVTAILLSLVFTLCPSRFAQGLSHNRQKLGANFRSVMSAIGGKADMKPTRTNVR
jgi:hypothetical protein